MLETVSGQIPLPVSPPRASPDSLRRIRLYLGLERDEAVRFTGDGVYHLMPLRVKSMQKKSGPQIAGRLGKSGFSLPVFRRLDSGGMLG